jgi:hypothetical protein
MEQLFQSGAVGKQVYRFKGESASDSDLSQSPSNQAILIEEWSRSSAEVVLIVLKGDDGKAAVLVYEYIPQRTVRQGARLAEDARDILVPARYVLRGYLREVNDLRYQHIKEIAHTFVWAEHRAQRAETIAASATFVLHLIPGGATTDYAIQGDGWNTAISAVGDLAFFTGLGAMAEMKNAVLVTRLGKAAAVLEGIVGVARSGQAVHLAIKGDKWGAAGAAGEALLRFFGMSVQLIQARRMEAAAAVLNLQFTKAQLPRLSDGYLTSAERIARYRARIGQLSDAGWDGERLAELQGRLEMLEGGYLKAGHGKYNSAGHGIDAVYQHSKSGDVAILESKWRATWNGTSSPRGVRGLMGRGYGYEQMSDEWVNAVIARMSVSSSPYAQRMAVFLQTHGYQYKFVNVMTGKGLSLLFGILW